MTTEEKMQIEQIVNQGLEIERLTKEVKDLTDNLAKAKQYHAGELADVTAELAEMQAERDSLSVAAALWNKRYIDACQQHADRQTNLGHQIVALEAERDAYRSWGSQNEASFSAERDSLKSALLGAQALIAELQSERDALKAALQLIKANTNTLDWPDDINAAIQGAGK